MQFAIYDLDGVLVEIGDRLQHLQRVRPDHDAFNREGCTTAMPIVRVARIVRALMEDGVYTVLFTGRSDKWRDLTVAWLRRYDIPYHLLLMRPEGDHRSDLKMKRLWLTAYDPEDVLCIMEDRDHLVDEWRRLGFTVLQPQKGAY